MAFNIPTTQSRKDTNLANLEGKLGQTSPINDKAFLRVLSAVLALQDTSLYKFAAQQALENLTITASREGLIAIGAERNVPIRDAEAAVVTATLPGTNGTVIPITNDFVGDVNGIRYSIDAASTISGGVATLSLTAETLGASGNLSIGNTLTIGTPVAGATSVATVTAVTNTGADAEPTETYRQRLLTVIRTIPGGGNASDYRIWATEVAGVKQAYPYAGQPVGALDPDEAGDRTVYVEVEESIDPDGIPGTPTLNEVRDTITTDPETGLARQPLGLTDDTLFIEPISRTSFFVTISDLDISADQEAVAKTEIETALDTYFRSVAPFVDGIDAVVERNDSITDPSVSEIVQDVVRPRGGNVSGVAFDTTPGGTISKYQLGQGELAKLGASPSYV